MAVPSKLSERRRRRCALLIFTAVATAFVGCTSAPIVLADPATGRVHDCGSRSEWTNWYGFANVTKERDCVTAYQADGWRLQ